MISTPPVLCDVGRLSANQPKQKRMEKTSMTETKYGKYIITQNDKPDNAPEADFKALLYLDDTVVPGALYTECAWLREPSTKSPPAHAHEFDEVLGFIGTDPANPQDLCGEVGIVAGDERHILTKTCVVFAPAD